MLEARGLGPTCLESRREPIDTWLRSAVQNTDAVVLVGGDGLVHAAAPLLAELDVPLLHDPAGTENLFAREISSSARPQSPERVAQRLEAMDVWRVDLVEVECTTPEGKSISAPMVIVASVGIDADVVWEVDASRSGSISRWSYAKPLLQNALSWRGTRATVCVDGEEISRGEKAMVMLGNCPQYAGRLNPIRYARIDSGLIDVLVMPAKTALGVAGYALAAWLGGSHLGSRHVRYRTGKVVVVEFQEPCAWEVDGDPPPEKDRIVRLEARVRPGGLPVVR